MCSSDLPLSKIATSVPSPRVTPLANQVQTGPFLLKARHQCTVRDCSTIELEGRSPSAERLAFSICSEFLGGSASELVVGSRSTSEPLPQNQPHYCTFPALPTEHSSRGGALLASPA